MCKFNRCGGIRRNQRRVRQQGIVEYSRHVIPDHSYSVTLSIDRFGVALVAVGIENDPAASRGVVLFMLGPPCSPSFPLNLPL